MTFLSISLPISYEHFSGRREIHTSDLIRADVGNKDFQDDDPTKIHWEKFNMIGRFIDSISQCQNSCREINSREDMAQENKGYTDQEDPKVRDLLLFNKRYMLLDPEVCPPSLNDYVRF